MNIRNEIRILVKTKNEITDNSNIKLLFKKLIVLSKENQSNDIVKMEKIILHELLFESNRVTELFNEQLKKTLHGLGQ